MFFNKFRDKFKNLLLSCGEFSYGHCPVPSVDMYKYIQSFTFYQARNECVLCRFQPLLLHYIYGKQLLISLKKVFLPSSRNAKLSAWG